MTTLSEPPSTGMSLLESEGSKNLVWHPDPTLPTNSPMVAPVHCPRELKSRVNASVVERNVAIKTAVRSSHIVGSHSG